MFSVKLLKALAICVCSIFVLTNLAISETCMYGYDESCPITLLCKTHHPDGGSSSDDIDLGQEANKMGQGAMMTYGGIALTAGGVGLIATGQPYKGLAAIGGGILAIGSGVEKFWDGITTIHNHNQ